MRIFLCVAPLMLASLLCSCGTSQISGWSKPGGSESQKSQDMAECDYDASKATAGNMQAPKSTSDAVDSGVARGMEKSDLIKKCMRLRGYQ
jgi:hypothetical protein